MRHIFLILMLTLVTACGGGGGGGSNRIDRNPTPATPPPVPDDEIGGIYALTFHNVVSGVEAGLVLYIAEDGEFHAFDFPGGPYEDYYLHGQLDVDGFDLTGSGMQIAPQYTSGIYLDEQNVYARRVTHDINGNVTLERTQLDGTFDLQGGSDHGPIQATTSDELKAVYAINSDFATIAGSYEDQYMYSGLKVTVDANGQISSNITECAIAGEVTPIDSRYNLYEVEIAVPELGCIDWIPGKYEGMAVVDQSDGSQLLVVAGDNGSDAYFTYVLIRL